MATESPGLLLFGGKVRRYAIRIDQVERVLPAVALSALSGAPPIVAGVFSLHGDIVPVLDLDQYFGDPALQLLPGSRFILLALTDRRLALAASAVGTVEEDRLEREGPAELGFGLGRVSRIAGDRHGVVYCYEPEALLLPVEAAALDVALARRTA